MFPFSVKLIISDYFILKHPINFNFREWACEIFTTSFIIPNYIGWITCISHIKCGNDSCFGLWCIFVEVYLIKVYTIGYVGQYCPPPRLYMPHNRHVFQIS